MSTECLVGVDARGEGLTVTCDGMIQIPEDGEELEEEEMEQLQEVMEADYEIGSVIKEKLIPHAVHWFTGEALQELEDDDDDEDDDDEDGEDDDDEEGAAMPSVGAIPLSAAPISRGACQERPAALESNYSPAISLLSTHCWDMGSHCVFAAVAYLAYLLHHLVCH